MEEELIHLLVKNFMVIPCDDPSLIVRFGRRNLSIRIVYVHKWGVFGKLGKSLR